MTSSKFSQYKVKIVKLDTEKKNRKCELKPVKEKSF